MWFSASSSASRELVIGIFPVRKSELYEQEWYGSRLSMRFYSPVITSANVPGEQRCRHTKISRIYQHDIVVIAPGQHKVVGVVRSMVLGLLVPAGLLHRRWSSCGTNSFVAWRVQRKRALATKRSYVRTRRHSPSPKILSTAASNIKSWLYSNPTYSDTYLAPFSWSRVCEGRGEVRPSWTKAGNKDTHEKEQVRPR